ncbi:uncharacterized protein BO97DRAFT_478823 [Aspergillus homomorphus CBS 101889]|uniref:Uncharacterized protein n=1 Tax=Aspergillus homomorphus (strain CBS 101889) TaxID=1450537 RepID=A0A395HSP1_ASPHC|nr:hypothetical protein BO97DRAFT_478823 [Aspergillus homomorphus CBS 101889]RAL10962.1 hypothetical protein BO97DRAFT_478823 [Aspergillus homomorphus CBS 101889]
MQELDLLGEKVNRIRDRRALREYLADYLDYLPAFIKAAADRDQDASTEVLARDLVNLCEIRDLYQIINRTYATTVERLQTIAHLHPSERLCFASRYRLLQSAGLFMAAGRDLSISSLPDNYAPPVPLAPQLVSPDASSQGNRCGEPSPTPVETDARTRPVEGWSAAMETERRWTGPSAGGPTVPSSLRHLLNPLLPVSSEPTGIRGRQRAAAVVLDDCGQRVASTR